MFQITIELAYPWSPTIPEEKEVTFLLSGEYPCTTSSRAREVVQTLIAAGNPGTVLDANGILWPFFQKTVVGIHAEEISCTEGADG